MSSLFFVSNTIAQAHTFTRSLRVGDSSEDVRELQKILNNVLDSKISNIGAGSPGQETMYFGRLTEQAVKRFQEKYTIEILFPSGLLNGTGVVGPQTLKKLNSLSLTTPISASSNQNMAKNNTSMDFIVRESEKIDIYSTDKTMQNTKDEITKRINSSLAARASALSISDIMDTTSGDVSTVIISKINPQIARKGSVVTIAGRGFDGSSTIYIGNNYIIRNPNRTASTLSFSLPDLPAGKYDVVVKTNRGLSNTIFLVVASNMVNSVRIDSLSPQIVPFGSTVTITGSGFTSENNDIYTPLGKLGGISSSDGKTLSFTFRPEIFTEMAKMSAGSKTLPMQLYIVNGNGYTQAASFILSY
jgi:hypothetical protein